tara:strand:+ start:281 stop:679 length:399 start_codon:yes stop_codon:yes gene_type:complete
MFRLVILIVFFSVVSCSISEKEIHGVYIFENKYIVDSLTVLDDFSYVRRIFSINNNMNLYSFKGRWSYSDEHIIFKDFFNKYDLGNDVYRDGKIKGQTINTGLYPNKTIFGTIVLDIDRFNSFHKTSCPRSR